ncbi:MAG TPA: inactive serine/threonine-protein kinase VRK3 [Burkholderiales bacterium]
MAFVALTCPQCGAPLPRQARWRNVTCPYCTAVVTRARDVVQAAWFREAAQRARAADSSGQLWRWRGAAYRVLAPLGGGDAADVFLAQRLFPAERVVIKLARDAVTAAALEREAAILARLQGLQTAGSAYFTQRLPQPIGAGIAHDGAGNERTALLLRHPSGYWGSLEDARAGYPVGIDPRHVVWMWRRVLEVLAYTHDNGWAHGRLCNRHLLVHPRNHGVLIIGWSQAHEGANAQAKARDLRQVAWSMRALLSAGEGEPAIAATVPAPLARVLRLASEDESACDALGARGIEAELKAAAGEAFGAPRFVVFEPAPRGPAN